MKSALMIALFAMMTGGMGAAAEAAPQVGDAARTRCRALNARIPAFAITNCRR